MKKFLLALLVSSQLVAQDNKLHFNLNSHNETSDPQNYLQALGHNIIRPLVKQVADSVNFWGIKWNMQVDANFVRGTLIHDTAYSNPNDIIQYCDNSQNIEIDPHNHFNVNGNPYNFADIQHLLDSCGLPNPSITVGGFLYDSTDWMTAQDKWTAWQNGMQGYTYPWYTWYPEALWGAGSPSHTNDVSIYGVYKPHSANSYTDFISHNPNRNLAVVGNGCAWVLFDSTNNPMWIVNDIIRVLNILQNTPINNNTYYTASLMINFKHFTSSNYMNKLSTIINALEPYGPNGTGQIVWELNSTKLNNWQTNHTNQNDYFIDFCSTLTDVPSSEENEMEVNIYPIPAADELNVFLNAGNNTGANLKIYNTLGQIIYSQQISAGLTAINTTAFANGTYLVKASAGKLQKSKTIIIAK